MKTPFALLLTSLLVLTGLALNACNDGVSEITEEFDGTLALAGAPLLIDGTSPVAGSATLKFSVIRQDHDKSYANARLELVDANQRMYEFFLPSGIKSMENQSLTVEASTTGNSVRLDLDTYDVRTEGKPYVTYSNCDVSCGWSCDNTGYCTDDCVTGKQWVKLRDDTITRNIQLSLGAAQVVFEGSTTIPDRIVLGEGECIQD